MKTKKKKGFTLTELIVVIVIIGVLAAVMIPTLTGYITKAQNSKDEALVASLNRSYENTKIMDDIEIYTAYDVQAFLKEVDMENIEVSNKSNLILFDADDKKFVLVKDIKTETKANEFVYHISEYYSYKKLKAEPLNNKNSNAVLKPLVSIKLGENEGNNTYEYHRSFIISINGNEISEAVGTFMKINGDTTQDELDEMKGVFIKTYSDSKFKENLSNAIFKTLFIGKTKSFYIDSNYKINIFKGTNPSGQSLKRVAILGDVEEVDLSEINSLDNSTIIVPNTVSNVIIPSDLKSSIQLSGNVDKDNDNYIDLNSALILPLAKELLDVDPNVTNEKELNEVLKSYDSESIIAEIVKKSGLKENDDIIKNLKANLDKIDKTIVICNTFSITKNTTIPAGVTVIVPYRTIDENHDGICEATDAGPTPIAKIYNATKEETDGRYVNLIIEEEIKLDIYGTVKVGGKINSYQPIVCNTYGSYGQITNNGVINLYASSKNNNNYNGTLDVYGYVIGDGKINSEGGIIIQPITIGDYSGGNNTILLVGESVSPFTQYCLANIWCETTIDSNSKYQCRGYVYSSGINEIPAFSIIENGGDSALIRMNESTKIVVYYKADELEQSNDRNKLTCLGKVHITITGGAETGAFKMNLGGTELNTSNFTLPIPYNFCYEFKNSDSEGGDEYKITSKIALLPGSKLIVGSGTKLTISSSANLTVIDKLSSYDLTLKDADTHKYPENLDAAQLVLKGHLIVEGGIGGLITGSLDAKIEIGSKADGVYKNKNSVSYVYARFGRATAGNFFNKYQCYLTKDEDEGNNITPERNKIYTCDENGYWSVLNNN